jgi:hypothetical protein
MNRGTFEPPREEPEWAQRGKNNPSQKNWKDCQENQKFINSNGKWTINCAGVVASPSPMHSSILNGALFEEREKINLI